MEVVIHAPPPHKPTSCHPHIQQYSVLQINFMSWGGDALIFALEIIYSSGTDTEQSVSVILGVQSAYEMGTARKTVSV